MITKIRLAAKAPNEGARLLAQWILQQPAGTYDKLIRRAGVGVIGMDRIMAGEVIPGRAIAYQIYAFAAQSVPISNWYRPPVGGWFDFAQPLRRAA